MLLKIGELAARTQLTVRALHHYDAIGLLRPSARTDAGYRLYDDSDVARLHAILALRQFGVPLADIADILQGQGLDLPQILARQIAAIDLHIAQSSALRARLILLQDKFNTGDTPDANDWLRTLARMNTFQRYFSTAELQRIFERQRRSTPHWQQLFADVQAAMDQGLPADCAQVQPLARRWTHLMIDWMDGDFDLMKRWGDIYAREPQVYTRHCPTPAMVRFIGEATELRKDAFLRHMSLDELMQIRPPTDAQWQQLATQCEHLERSGEALTGAAARRLVKSWISMGMACAGQRTDLFCKLRSAMQLEPLLQYQEEPQRQLSAWIQRALVAQAHPLKAYQSVA